MDSTHDVTLETAAPSSKYDTHWQKSVWAAWLESNERNAGLISGIDYFLHIHDFHFYCIVWGCSPRFIHGESINPSLQQGTQSTGCPGKDAMTKLHGQMIQVSILMVSPCI